MEKVESGQKRRRMLVLTSSSERKTRYGFSFSSLQQPVRAIRLRAWTNAESTCEVRHRISRKKMSARKDNGNQCSQNSLMFPTAKGLPGVAFNVQFSLAFFWFHLQSRWICQQRMRRRRMKSRTKTIITAFCGAIESEPGVVGLWCQWLQWDRFHPKFKNIMDYFQQNLPAPLCKTSTCPFRLHITVTNVNLDGRKSFTEFRYSSHGWLTLRTHQLRLTWAHGVNKV